MRDAGSAAQARAWENTFPAMGIPASLSICEASTTVQQRTHEQVNLSYRAQSYP